MTASGLDAEGRFYVASTIEHGVRVVEADGNVDLLEIAGEGLTTNCCFGWTPPPHPHATDAIPAPSSCWKACPTRDSRYQTVDRLATAAAVDDGDAVLRQPTFRMISFNSIKVSISIAARRVLL